MEYVQMTLDDWVQMKQKLRQELIGVKQSFVRIGYALRQRIIESLQTGPRNRQEKRALESKLRRRKNPHKSLKNQSLRALKRKKMKPKA